jgi:hypothetical protein
MDGNVSSSQAPINFQQFYAASPIKRQDIMNLIHVRTILLFSEKYLKTFFKFSPFLEN